MVCQIWKNCWQVVAASMNQKKQPTKTMGGVSWQKNSRWSCCWSSAVRILETQSKEQLKMQNLELKLFALISLQVFEAMAIWYMYFWVLPCIDWLTAWNKVLGSLLTIYEKMGRCSEVLRRIVRSEVRDDHISTEIKRDFFLVFTSDFKEILQCSSKGKNKLLLQTHLQQQL